MIVFNLFNIYKFYKEETTTKHTNSIKHNIEHKSC